MGQGGQGDLPDLARRIVNEGHRIGGHSYFHTVFNTLRPYDQQVNQSYVRVVRVAG